MAGPTKYTKGRYSDAVCFLENPLPGLSGKQTGGRPGLRRGGDAHDPCYGRAGRRCGTRIHPEVPPLPSRRRSGPRGCPFTARGRQLKPSKGLLSVAAANGVVPGQGTAAISLQFGTNEFDEQTVSVTASQDTPTLLMRLIGEEKMEVQSRAVAAVPPVDLVLVLDRSGSLGQAGVWGDLQEAAKAVHPTFR